jgi:hypothetical protein
MIRSVTLIPSSGEFVYATTPITSNVLPPNDIQIITNSEDTAELVNLTSHGVAHVDQSLSNLVASCPNVESVSIVVSWFGTDLRAGDCTIRPGVETFGVATDPLSWSVNGVTRSSAYLVSQDSNNRPYYGGTPSDNSIVETIAAIKARGLKVTFYPFILMDVPPDNTLPDPYSDNASQTGQSVFPWRGRITCSPASGYAGSVDKTAAAAAQVNSFFGNASITDFSVSGTNVSWTGSPTEWGFRRMILHYAHLCAAAGGVDAFLIGSEMRGLTTIRSNASNYPAVQKFIELAADVRAILGSSTKISYAADWSEYFGHQPQDGSGDVFFHLDPLWSDSNIDFIGIDNYMPLSDWRDGFNHLDAQEGWKTIYDIDYLKNNIARGEGYDWFYASNADREAQIRTPITDGAYNKPWVFRYKDLRNWWSNQHFNRPNGIESGAPTAWVPESKQFWFTEAGCPAIDRGTNQPNVFFDPKSSESAVPYFSRSWFDTIIQRQYIKALHYYWSDSANNPLSTVTNLPMLDLNNTSIWTWDARPYPEFPVENDMWNDRANWEFGHWITGRIGSADVAGLVYELCKEAGVDSNRIDTYKLYGQVEGYVIITAMSATQCIEPVARFFLFDGYEKEGILQFSHRGNGSDHRIPFEHFLWNEGDEEPSVSVERIADKELPAYLSWSAQRSDGGYKTIMVDSYYESPVSDSRNAENFPFSAYPACLYRQAHIYHYNTWASRNILQGSLPPSYGVVHPGDSIEVVNENGNVYRYTVARTDFLDMLKIECRSFNPAILDAAFYDDIIPKDTTQTDRRISGFFTQVLDLPVYRNEQSQTSVEVRSFSPQWGLGAVVITEGGESVAIETPSIFGVLLTELPPGQPHVIDHGTEFTAVMSEQTMVSVSDSEFLNNINLFAVVHPNNEYEIISVQNIQLVGTRTYRFSKLIRGLFGTDVNSSQEKPVDSILVLLRRQGNELPYGIEDIGIETSITVGPLGVPLSDQRFSEIEYTPDGRGLSPYAPVISVHPITYRTDNNIVINWIRRDRSLQSDSFNLEEIPLSESSESYRLTILDNTDIVREVTVNNSTTYTYTGSQQIADFGIVLPRNSTLRVRIRQLSNVLVKPLVAEYELKV